MKRKILKKSTCLSCSHWNRIKTGNPIIINDKTPIPEILKQIPKGKTAEITNEGNMQLVEFYCKIGHTKDNGSNCKDFEKNPNIIED